MQLKSSPSDRPCRPTIRLFLLIALSAATSVECLINRNAGIPKCEGTLQPQVVETECLRERQIQSKAKNIPKLVRNPSNEEVTIKCSICPADNKDEYVWIWIKRASSSQGSLFKQNTNGEELNDKLLEKYTPPTGSSVCYDEYTNNLIFKPFKHDLDMGTYVCKNVYKADHQSNTIFYHYDVIEKENIINPIRLPAAGMQRISVENTEELERYNDIAVRDFLAVPDYKETQFDLLTLSSRVSDNFTHFFGCGPFMVELKRTCFIRLPRDSAWSGVNSDDERVLLSLLWKAFSFLNVPRGSEQEAVRRRATRLGFDYHASDFNIYVPCRYTLLKQLPTMNGRFRPYTTTGISTVSEYDVTCPALDPMELINVALMLDVNNFKMQPLVAFEDGRSMTVERIAIEYDENFDLTCSIEADPVILPQQDIDEYDDDETSEKSKLGKCHPSFETSVLWRTEEGIMLEPKTVLNERIHVTENCNLRFDSVAIDDSDVYQCFIRDQRTPTGWRKRPRLIYRLNVQVQHYKPAETRAVLVGLSLLLAWAVVVTAAWMLLLIYNMVSYSRTIGVAEQRRGKMDKVQANRPRAWTSEYKRMSTILLQNEGKHTEEDLA